MKSGSKECLLAILCGLTLIARVSCQPSGNDFLSVKSGPGTLTHYVSSSGRHASAQNGWKYTADMSCDGGPNRTAWADADYIPSLLSGAHHSRPGLLYFCSRWN